MGRRASGPKSLRRLEAVGLVALSLLVSTGCGGDPPAADDLSPQPVGPVALDWPAAELRAGGAVEAVLGRGESHLHRLPLDAGRMVRIRVEQTGVDVELLWKDPDGAVVLTADRLIAEHGPELVLVVTGASGDHTLEVRAFDSHGPGRYRAEIEALRPATADDRRAADAYLRFREAETYAREDRSRAGAAWSAALATWRRLGEPELEAEVLDRMALDHHDAGEWRKAAERWAEAAAIFERLGSARWELFARDDLATALVRLTRHDEAVTEYRTAAGLARALGDRRQEASALYGLATVFQRQGELQRALTTYEASLEHLPADHPDRATALHSLGSLYRLHFQDPRRARELLEAARDLYRPEAVPTDAAFQARALHQLALLARDAGRPEEARGYLEQALAVRTAFDRCGRAGALSSLALVEDEAGRRRAADERMAEAFAVLEDASCAGSRAALDLVAGELAERRGEPDAARAAYRQGSERAAAIGDRRRVADGLAGVARAERALGRLPEALAASGRVLEIVEEIRPTVLREDLRTAFFATAQDRYDLHVGLLSDLGRHAEAWATAERARARALRDLLAEAGAGLRRDADPELVARERELRHAVNLLEGRRVRAAEADGERSRELRREIDDRVAELERARGEIRRASPAYAAVAGDESLALAEVRRELLGGAEDAGTLLLEYRLGREESWLWVIGADVFEAFSLPPRAEIERAAEVAARWARSLQWPGHAPAPLCELSRAVLGPAAPLLAGRRLVLVPDGALESVPFAALPDPAGLTRSRGPCPEAPLLVEGHEIVHLPSAAALAAQRRMYEARPPAPGWLAMVADPVYGPDDTRLADGAGPREAADSGPPAGAHAGRGVGFERLPYSGEEAAAVLAGLPRERVLAATGLDASKATVASGALAHHRIVHFATHGVLDAEQPLLSHLALSDGALYAHEIYDLELPAELVVLSACDTARGRLTRGEGLVSGLPRAFLYAGAERALVSLWPVQDRSTRDLMRLFYAGLVDRDLPPGRALQEAQRALHRAGRPPRRWAGFVLQGDWRPLPPFAP